MATMHPLLAEALAKFKAGELTQQAYDAERQRILRDEIGIGDAAPVAPVTAATVAAIAQQAKDALAAKKAEADRIRTTLDRARSLGRLTSYVAPEAKRPDYVAKSIEIEPGVRRVLTDAEIQAAKQASVKAAEPTPVKIPVDRAAFEIPSGFEVHNGVLRPKPKALTDDPIVRAVRERFKAGEFGVPGSSEAQEKARQEIARLRSDKPDSKPRLACPLCKGNPDKITGKTVCPCKGTGWIQLDLDGAIDRASKGSGCVDPLAENPDSVTYTAFLSSGGCTTIHADSGQKAVRGACQSLRAAANGFEKVVFDDGVMLVLPRYETLCPACHGTRKAEGKTCTQCDERGRVAKVGARFYFGDTCNACKGHKFRVSTDAQGGQTAEPCKACNETGRNTSPAEDRAHEAGLASMLGHDSSRRCERKKCKGPTCRACYDAQQGGYQRDGYVKCSACKDGKIHGVDCEKCRGKGYFNVTEFFWTDEITVEEDAGVVVCAPRFAVTNEIRRVDLLAEDRYPKRDRNVTIKIGNDLVEVGSGKVPSRKSGAVMHLTGTARNKWDTAEKLYGAQKVVTAYKPGDKRGKPSGKAWSHKRTQGVVWNASAHGDRSTFSDG